MGARLLGAVACGLVAADCVEKAIGIEPQHMFSEKALWLWWLGAIGWFCNAVRLCFDN